MSTDTFTSMTSVDGTVTRTAEARVPVLDRGFLYGDSVYEVFRTYSGVPLFYDEHWRRLENSAALSRMHISQTREQITDEIRRTVRATGASELHRDVYVRYTITRGEGPVDLYAKPGLRTRYIVIVKAAIPRIRRNPVDALDPNIKGGNYLNNVLALTEAKQLGADECIILNHENIVTEASNSNVFFVIDGELVTPDPGAGNLMGLTKQAAIEACGGDGLAVRERDIPADELDRATECFVTSATREVMPVVSLRLEDGREVAFPPGGGAITRRVAALYKAHIEGYVAAHAADSFW
jgi:branched-chain amino acid aminotransferase